MCVTSYLRGSVRVCVGHRVLVPTLFFRALQDLRTPERSARTIAPRSDSVRDLQFDPHKPGYFSAAFENGTVQVRATKARGRILQAEDFKTKRSSEQVFRVMHGFAVE